ncbi:hypothetical protein ACFO4L_01085 [Bacillus daqingensis]|uniref:Uncharacterized protein n=1 Tax=Bacillus daqingensis TaxID=872396 RepID=A0ABV9NSZ7_9BACI
MGTEYKMLCKIEKVIPKGHKFDLFDLEELEKKLLTRKQRRSKKSEGLPNEFKENVKGPAAIVMPIAIYR